MTTTFYVLARPVNGQRIVTSIFNPSEGMILAEFAVPSLPFHPWDDEYLNEVYRLHAETEAKAQEFLAANP